MLLSFNPRAARATSPGPAFASPTAMALAVFMLTGCGGDGTPPGSDTAAVITGVAATGAPFAAAKVTAADARGAIIDCGMTADDGRYRCVLPADAVGPFVLTAARDGETHYSVSPARSDGTVNITSLTDVIVSQLAPSGDPASLAGALRQNPALASTEAVRERTGRLLAALQPLYTALGTAQADPITVPFAADGKGLDRVLDSVLVSVRPAGSSTNVSIAVRSTDAEPPTVRFATGSGAANTAIDPLPQLDASRLPVLPGPALTADLMQRLTACYALKPSERVTGGNDSGAVTGTASSVIAPACRTLFVDDDPATYLQDGQPVGRDGSNRGAFAGLFRAGATGARFDAAVVAYVRSEAPNDMVVSYRRTDASGEQTQDTLIARSVAGALKLIGNQYQYAARVRPYQEYRELVHTPRYSSYNVGYNVDIDDVRRTDGVSIFSKVVVTPPAGLLAEGASYTFVPQAGLSFLVLQGVPGVNALRLNGAFKDASVTTPVSEMERGIYFISPLMSDDQIARLPEQGLWRMDFHFADGSAPVTQTIRTLSRTSGIAELRTLPMLDLTDAMRAELVDGTKGDNAIPFDVADRMDLSAAGGADAWMLPAGAPAANALTIVGNAPFGSTWPNRPGANFTDRMALASSARRAVLSCARVHSADMHCDAATPGLFAKGTTVQQIIFTSYGARQVQTSRRFVFYRLGDATASGQ